MRWRAELESRWAGFSAFCQQDYVIQPGMREAEFSFLVAEPSLFRVCYCAYVDGGASCVDNSGHAIVELFTHYAAYVRVDGRVPSEPLLCDW